MTNKRNIIQSFIILLGGIGVLIIQNPLGMMLKEDTVNYIGLSILLGLIFVLILNGFEALNRLKKQREEWGNYYKRKIIIKTYSVVLLTISIIAVLEFIFFCFLLSSYPTIQVEYIFAILIITAVSALVLRERALKFRTRTMRKFIKSLLVGLSILPILFLFFKPIYSYVEARQMLEHIEGIEIDDYEEVKINYRQDYYFFYGFHDNVKRIFWVHPDSGQILEREIGEIE
ncbi:hypothetical protein LC040_11000 [Bacillus tianshenii]|nr:hypothetical protein LC040_11000 [Bacillus tianshenii]